MYQNRNPLHNPEEESRIQIWNTDPEKVWIKIEICQIEDSNMNL